jgi:hypothetical protein
VEAKAEAREVEGHMSLPPYLTRIHNAAGPLLGGIAESELAERLGEVSLTLEINEKLSADPGHRSAYLLAANLGARLYPRLSLDAPDELTERAAKLAQEVNPGCEFGQPKRRALCLSWKGGRATADRVTVKAANWNLGIDGRGPASGSAAPPAAMAAAALGLGELFRALFADLLPHGRRGSQPMSLNLLTLGEASEASPMPEEVELGEVHLAGCGAIGQAFTLALTELPVRGRLIAVDHDALDDGNLQRYVLGRMSDVGTRKPAMIASALAHHHLEVEEVTTRWGEDERTAPGRQTVVSALDSKQGRIELQAGLPRELFNAWTQPEDLGVSRHLAFGEVPCLACLAWPTRARPGESELIAEALGEHELRVLAYMHSGIPVGQPLPTPVEGSRRLKVPEGSDSWLERSLLADLVDRFGLPQEHIASLSSLPVAGLYRDAVCAGMLLEHRGNQSEDISVPLAHQSALAGILLATWLYASRSEALRDFLPSAPEARYNVLRRGPQVWELHRSREPRCICFDGDFLDAFARRWS